jgi:predicted metal-binding membrane protein
MTEASAQRSVDWNRLVALLALVTVFTLAAAYTVLGIGLDMSALEMTSMPRDMLMARPAWTPIYGATVFMMWWVMMIAMMVPAATPMILLHMELQRRTMGAASALRSTGSFGIGYLSVWGLFSVSAMLLQWLMDEAGWLSAMMATSTLTIGGLILIAAGAYQLTPLKGTCLARCQNPVRFMVTHRRPGLSGAFKLGLLHGAHCVGCCAFLMMLLFFGGIMNLYWIAGLSAYVLIERVLVRRRWVGRGVGAILIVAGAALITAEASGALQG